MASVTIELRLNDGKELELLQMKRFYGPEKIRLGWFSDYGIRKVIVDDRGTRVYLDSLVEPIRPQHSMKVRNLEPGMANFSVVINPEPQIIPEEN